MKHDLRARGGAKILLIPNSQGVNSVSFAYALARILTCMRNFPSAGLRPLHRQRRVSELDSHSDHEPLVTVGVLVRIGLLLFIVLGLAMTAQLLFGASH